MLRTVYQKFVKRSRGRFLTTATQRHFQLSCTSRAFSSTDSPPPPPSSSSASSSGKSNRNSGGSDSFDSFVKTLTQAGRQSHPKMDSPTPTPSTSATSTSTTKANTEKDGKQESPSTTPRPIQSLDFSSLRAGETQEQQMDPVQTMDYKTLLDEEVLRIRRQREEYYVVMKEAAAARYADEALQLLGNLRAQSIPIDVNLYNAALAACSEELSRFDQVRTEMRQEKVSPSFATHSIICSVCEKNGLVEEAYLTQTDIMRQLKTTPRAQLRLDLKASQYQLESFNFIPVTAIYYGLIMVDLRRGNARRALLYMLEMTENKVKFTYSMAEMVIDACETLGFCDEADKARELVKPQNLLHDDGKFEEFVHDSREAQDDFNETQYYQRHALLPLPQTMREMANDALPAFAKRDLLQRYASHIAPKSRRDNDDYFEYEH